MSSLKKLIKGVRMNNEIKNSKKCKEYKDRMEYMSVIYQNYLKGYGNFGPDWLKKYKEYDMMLYDKYHKRNCPKYSEIYREEKKEKEYEYEPQIIKSRDMEIYRGGYKINYKKKRKKKTTKLYRKKRSIRNRKNKSRKISRSKSRYRVKK